MNISWIILTFNRNKIVEETFKLNVLRAGYPIPLDVVHVDNGSNLTPKIPASTTIKFNRNLGVAKGYNAGYSAAREDFVLITGCDRVMPDNWLQQMVHHFLTIPKTGILSCYSQPISKVPERYRGGKFPIEVNNKKIIECMPMEARMLSRELFLKIGYLREDFGIYGHEDLEWAERAERVTKELGLINYTLPDFIANHVGTEGVVDYNGIDDKDYWAMKRREVQDPWKEKLLQMKRQQKNPFYNPYCKCGDKNEIKK